MGCLLATALYNFESSAADHPINWPQGPKGWRLIRIPERVLKASKPNQKWLREQKQRQREIRAACKPPRLHINLATKAVQAKRAHFKRVALRKGA